MTSIRCPICGSFMEGDGESALTVILRQHLSSVHDLRDQGDVLASRETLGHHPELWEQIKRGTVRFEREVGEDIEVSILCPFCGDRFFGHDGEDLTQSLIAHFQDVHGIKTMGRSLTLVR
jgi:sarcosine oxidase delta subunit